MDVRPLDPKHIEEIVISSMLNSTDAMVYCANELKGDEFNNLYFQDIFKLMVELFNSLGRPVCFADVFAEMIKRRMPINDLVMLQNKTALIIDIKNIVWQLKDIYATNYLALINKEINDRLIKGEDWYDICVDSINKMERLEDEYSKVNISFQREIDSIVDSIINKTGKSYSKLNVGYPMLNNANILFSNNLIFLAASPKAGKTRFISSVVKSLLELNDNVSILWFSGEDPKDVVIRYILSLVSGVPDNILSGTNKGSISPEDLVKVKEAKEFLRDKDLHIIDEPQTIDTVQVKFNTFCNKRKHRFNILIYDNFNIAKDLLSGNMTTNDKDTYIASKFQHINTINNRNGKVSMTIVLDHLSKDNLRKQSLEEGYRPRLEQLKGSSRKYEVVSQLLFLNRPSLYKDLMAEEEKKSKLIINGHKFVRTDILKDMLILEVAANRHGEVHDDTMLIRYDADFKTMQITEYPPGVIQVGEYEAYEERNITTVTDEVVKDILKIYGDNDFFSLKVQLQYVVETRKFDVHNNRLTVDFLLNKYASYVESLRDYQNGAYTKKGKDILNFDMFLNKTLYEQTFNKIEHSTELTRDSYLYGV